MGGQKVSQNPHGAIRCCDELTGQLLDTFPSSLGHCGGEARFSDPSLNGLR
jgi:hypothetical protein